VLCIYGHAPAYAVAPRQRQRPLLLSFAVVHAQSEGAHVIVVLLQASAQSSAPQLPGRDTAELFHFFNQEGPLEAQLRQEVSAAPRACICVCGQVDSSEGCHLRQVRVSCMLCHQL